MFAGVVEAAEGRVVAVIGGDEAIVRRTHRRLDLDEPPVERLEAGGEAGDVAAMAVFGVEIDQVDEDEPAVRRGLQRLDQQIDVAVVALALALLSGVAVGENVADLADRDDRAARPSRPLQKIAVGRRHGEILAIGRADEIFRRFADEWARDHPPDLQRIAETPPDAAELVEPLEPKSLFVRGDLKDRVGRGVADRLPRPYMLLAELLDDGGARKHACCRGCRGACPRRSARR